MASTKSEVACLATSILYQGNEVEVLLKYDAKYFKKWHVWVTPLNRARPKTAKALKAKVLQLKMAVSRLLLGGGEWQTEGATEFGLVYHEFDDLDFGQSVAIKAIEGMPEIEWDGAWWVC